MTNADNFWKIVGLYMFFAIFNSIINAYISSDILEVLSTLLLFGIAFMIHTYIVTNSEK